jgi:hypothetical protein
MTFYKLPHLGEWAALLLRIQEARRSNLGPRLPYPEFFCGFSHCAPKFRDETSYQATTASYLILSY